MSDVTDKVARASYDIDLVADVLVIGGGPAGAWAGLYAAREGARVVVVDKGYLGTSGAHASAGGSIYYIVPDDPVQREGQIVAHLPLAMGMADTSVIERAYDQTYENLQLMAEWGYIWPRNDEGKELRNGLRSPDTMAFLRKCLEKHGVTILDHSPALELLVSEGIVAGAAGVNRQTDQSWRVRAGGVVVATGGCAFQSGAMGTKGLTGDGYLLAGEVGAVFQGMEFSSQYAPSPKGSALSKTGMYEYGWSMWDGNGNEIKPGRTTAQALIDTGKAFVILDKYDEAGARALRRRQANSFAYFDRMGIDPFTQPFEIELKLEGTIRASGGIATDDNVATNVPGLFAAGDTSSKARLVGAAMSGAGPGLSWSFASGAWSGRQAARFARQFAANLNQRRVEPAGRAALRPDGGAGITSEEAIQAIKEEMLPLQKNFFRNGENLKASLERLDWLWNNGRGGVTSHDASGAASRRGRDLLKAREAAAMLAGGRLMYRSAEQRTETRGIHRRSDFGKLAPDQRHYIASGGLEHIWIRKDPIAFAPPPEPRFL